MKEGEENEGGKKGPGGKCSALFFFRRHALLFDSYFYLTKSIPFRDICKILAGNV